MAGETYLDFFLRRSSRGEYKGRMFCFPPFMRGKCDFRASKIKAIGSCNVGSYDYEDIGIAFDETDRHNQLTDHKRSILYDYKITEAQAYEYCKDHAILSPHYRKYERDGCTLCPNAKPEVREEWFREYPEARDLVVALQRIAARERPGIFPLRGHEWFIPEPWQDGYQYSIFDYSEEEEE